ncbi:MAG: formyltransferase family protein [Eubacteriales bacterium]
MKFSILLANTMRGKAYLQNLIANGLLPEKVLFLTNENTVMKEESNRLTLDQNTNQKLLRSIEGVQSVVNEKEHVEKTLKNHNIPYKLINTLQVNSEEVVQSVKNLPTKHVIYAGPGGTILKHDILNVGKQFIHVHPGDIPIYKGSTTVYYEMLLEKRLTCSIFYMNEAIDSGDMLYKKHYPIPKGYVDFDQVVDPLLRAETLVEWIKNCENKSENGLRGTTEKEQNFYIIHPVLKHLAILQARGNH